MFRWLGLVRTIWPQLIAYLVITVPIVIWIRLGSFEATPLDLEEAAIIDGAGHFDVFRDVALPIVRPGITVAVSLAEILSSNTFGLRRGARRPRDADAAGRRLQHELLRATRPGSARRGRARHDVADAPADHRRPAPDRRGPRRWGRQGRLATAHCSGG
jgi:hypothetical protein